MKLIVCILLLIGSALSFGQISFGDIMHYDAACSNGRCQIELTECKFRRYCGDNETLVVHTNPMFRGKMKKCCPGWTPDTIPEKYLYCVVDILFEDRRCKIESPNNFPDSNDTFKLASKCQSFDCLYLRKELKF